MNISVRPSDIKFSAKFSGESGYVYRTCEFNFTAKFSGETKFVCRTRDVGSSGINCSAIFRGETELVHRSSDVNSPFISRGKCINGWPKMWDGGILLKAISLFNMTGCVPHRRVIGCRGYSFDWLSPKRAKSKQNTVVGRFIIPSNETVRTLAC